MGRGVGIGVRIAQIPQKQADLSAKEVQHAGCRREVPTLSLPKRGTTVTVQSTLDKVGICRNENLVQAISLKTTRVDKNMNFIFNEPNVCNLFTIKWGFQKSHGIFVTKRGPINFIENRVYYSPQTAPVKVSRNLTLDIRSTTDYKDVERIDFP